MQLVVLGMHRSGTSVLARMLNMMGAYFGPEGISTGASAENPKGFWERRDVRDANDFVLHSLDCDWDTVSTFNLNNLMPEDKTAFINRATNILLDLDTHRTWMLKEPRLCLLLDLWKTLLEIPLYLHLYRNPLEVAKSLLKRNGIPVSVGIALWEKYNIDALNSSKGFPRISVSHYKLMTDPISEVGAIYAHLIDRGVAGIRLPSDNEIMSFVNESLYREKANEEQLAQHLNTHQSQLHEGFKLESVFVEGPDLVLSESAAWLLASYDAQKRDEQLQKNETQSLHEKLRDKKIVLEGQQAQFHTELESYKVDTRGKINAVRLQMEIQEKEWSKRYDDLQGEGLGLKTEYEEQINTLLKKIESRENELEEQQTQFHTELKCNKAEATGQIEAARLQLESQEREWLKRYDDLRVEGLELKNKHEERVNVQLKKLECREKELKEQQIQFQTERENFNRISHQELYAIKQALDARTSELALQKERHLSEIESLKRHARIELESRTATLTKLHNDVQKKLEQVSDMAAKQSREHAEILESRHLLLQQKEFDIESLTNISEQLLQSLEAVFKSRRWTLGHSLLSAPYRMLFKPLPPLITEHVDKLSFEYTRWKSASMTVSLEQNDTLKKDSVPTEAQPYNPIDEVEHKSRLLTYTNSKKRKRVVIYTAVFGDYDVIKTPEFLNPDFDYVCFTDIPIQGHPVWQFLPSSYFNADPTRIARYYKLHPHFYFKEYEIAVWIDANILIRDDVHYLIDRFATGDQPLGIFPHYRRGCTYDEADICVNSVKDEKDLILQQVERYREEGFPTNSGLPETNMVISRPGEKSTQDIFNCWWKELDNGSRRDQVSVMYALWKNQADFTRLVDSSTEIARYNRKNFELFEHKNNTSGSNPSVYQIPVFLRHIYEHSTYSWWDLLNASPVTDGILWRYRERTVDIIIPVHNALEDVRNCLESVEPTLLDTHRLILIDDGSDQETQDYLRDFAGKRTSYATLVRHETAKGYTKAANAGLQLSQAEYAILLNSDTIVTQKWILKLVQCGDSAREIGIVGPLSNAASWQSVPVIKEKDGSYSTNPLPDGMTPEDIDGICQRHFLPEFPRVQLVNGFCFCIKRSVIDAIGIFDEIAYPKGYNEENDYCFRATDAGFDLAIATHTYVYHAKSKSYTPKTRLILCEESRKQFEKTYGIRRISRATDSLRLQPLIDKVRTSVKKELSNV